ncbi:radical SAM family heme chaperone HemW [Corynebacterium sp. S7]
MSFGVYIHVPFCATRCGYCDFNTYTPTEVDSSYEQYLDSLERELALAEGPQADTVFIGGGTPSLMGAEGLCRILKAVKDNFGLAPGAEVTTESNPESTDPGFFEGIREAGFTRVSLGMQSASTPILKVLDRTHTPGRAVEAAREAKRAGFEHVNLDMIYGTPTETEDDVKKTLDHILSAEVDHVSAYSLIVEDGTAMARKVKRGELPAPSEDTFADRYELIARTLEAEGFDWYEVSNWSKPGGECQHNLIYWRGGRWWGAGPGAHSYMDNERFYNVKRPEKYNQLLSAGELPIADRERLTADDEHMEKIMLGLRLKEGIPLEWIADAALPVVRRHEEAGRLIVDKQVRVTKTGRLLADGIVTDILAAE